MPTDFRNTMSQKALEFSDPNTERETIAFTPSDPLALDIEDDELIRILDKNSQGYQDFYKKKDVFDRRKELEKYYFGRQIREKEKEKLLKDYESRYLDNVLYEIEATIKPLAMSRLPDLLITPGDDTEESYLTSMELSKAIDTEIKEQENRGVLGMAFKHLPVYFLGVIKYRWNPERDEYVFECIHPNYIEFDYTSPSPDADKMRWISQLVPLTVEEVMMRFPDKREELIEQLQLEGLAIPGEAEWSLLATKITMRETWFTWFKKSSEHEYERVEGTVWKYRKCILGKMKNPNFDYEGETRYFTYDNPLDRNTKRPLQAAELQLFAMTGEMPPGAEETKVYNNYFRFPRKPFFFMTYDQWGIHPMDETSRMEQNLSNQKSLDRRGKQLEETLDNRGHHIWSKEGGLSPQDIENLDMNDPEVDALVTGNVNTVHEFIPPERPTPQEFQEIQSIHDRMYDVSGSKAVRGEIQSQVATNTQISRENNFTRADDIVEETINRAAQWMAEAALQMIKLRYTKEHFREVLGDAGEAVYIKLHQNLIKDGMIVKIKASGTDKLRAQNNAMDMAKLKLIDPYTFFVDMGLSDPEGRTKKLMLLQADPNAYLQMVVKGLDSSKALAMALMNQQIQPGTMPMQEPPAVMGGPGNPGIPPQSPVQPPQQPPQAQQPLPVAPQQPQPGNTSAVPTAPPPMAPQGSPRMM